MLHKVLTAVHATRGLKPPRYESISGVRSAGASAPAVLVLLAALGTVPLLAHHATQAEFDKDKQRTITGVMTKVLWVNPHVNWIMDVKGPDGRITTWTLVGAGPGAFRAAGLSGRDFFKTGATYTATIALAHNGSSRGHIMTFKMPDGKLVTLWKGDFNDPLGR